VAFEWCINEEGNTLFQALMLVALCAYNVSYLRLLQSNWLQLCQPEPEPNPEPNPEAKPKPARGIDVEMLLQMPHTPAVQASSKTADCQTSAYHWNKG
jgi:hypothetical protein